MGDMRFGKTALALICFLFSSFVFFDFERPAFLFFTEYLAILGLFVWLGHDAAKGLQTMNVRKTQQKSTANSTARQSESFRAKRAAHCVGRCARFALARPLRCQGHNRLCKPRQGERV